jgi:hypothetical protein
MNLRDIGRDDADRIHMVHDRDQWRALVNTVRTFWFHKLLGNS